jgi:hypothetical protein
MAKHILDGNYFLEIDEQKSWHWNQIPEDFIIFKLPYAEYIFVHEEYYYLKDIKKDVMFVFYPRYRRTYIIDKSDYDSFIKKYFPNKKILIKSPSFFMFQIPLPSIGYASEKFFEDSNNIRLTISKNTAKKYRNDEDFTLRLSCKYDDELGKYDFDAIFLKSLDDVINISKEYQNYLSNILFVNRDIIKTNKIIKPYYKISPEEIDKITDDFFDILEQNEKENSKGMADYHEKIFNSELDELNWIALERDSTNYWNID